MGSFKNQKHRRTTPWKKASSLIKIKITEGAVEHSSDSLSGKPSENNPGVAEDRNSSKPTCDADAWELNQTAKPQ